MENLTDTLTTAFKGLSVGFSKYTRNYMANSPGSTFMTIPMKGSIVELPTFMLFETQKMLSFIPDAFAVNLDYIGFNTGYKTLSSNVKVALIAKFSERRLSKIALSNRTSPVYYGTFGAIFDEHFHPIMMLSWKLHKMSVDKDNPDKSILLPVNPILRIHPTVFINKDDPMKKFIANQIFPTALELVVSRPYVLPSHISFPDHRTHWSVQVIVDKMPFEVKEPSCPSISTTDESLINTALDNLDELIIT